MSTNKNNAYKLNFKISAIAIAVATALGSTPYVQAEEAEESQGIEEVIVTVRKRQESLQDIPTTVQALSEEFIEELGAKNMEDYTRFIPGLTLISFNPGSSNIIFRGITTGLGDFIGQAGASVYMDETSLTSVGSQPDIRMIDIQGVQALAGPQGTIYGGSAQAGVMRIQTNKPDLSGFDASVDMGYRTGSESDASYDINAMLNIPINEQFAIRLVAEKAEDGGFVDNVFGYTPNYNSLWGEVLSEYDNADMVEENWNSTDYDTMRVSARWEPNDDWAITFTHHYQKNESHASNDYNPFVGDLQAVYFNKNHREDEWNLSALTIEADLGWAQLVSSTSFFKRDVNLSVDGSVYFRSYTMYCAYYAKYCYGTQGRYTSAYTPGSDITGVVEETEWKDRFTQEIRLSHHGDDYDWLLGLFYEDGNDDWDSVWMKPTSLPGGFATSTAAGYWLDQHDHLDSYPEDPIATWLSTDRTTWTQVALFGEFTWHYDDKTDITVGGRYFQHDNDKYYLVYNPNNVRAPDYYEGSYATTVASGSDKDFVPKISISHKLSDSKMIYALYTEGFRPGGSNRKRGDPDRIVFDREFDPDKVANYEIGAKTRWAENTVQLNLSYFYMDWSDYQLEVVDPSKTACLDVSDPNYTDKCGQPWQKVVANMGDAHTQGLQTDVVWIPAEGWEVGGNFQLLEAETDTDVPIAGITAGLELPNVSELKSSAWVNRRWDVNFIPGGEMYFRGQYSYASESLNQIDSSNVYDTNPVLANDAFSIMDLSLGLISHENDWEVKFYINNVTDERAQYYNASGYGEYPFSSTGALGTAGDGLTPNPNAAQYDHYHRVYSNRPREYGIRFKMAWGD